MLLADLVLVAHLLHRLRVLGGLLALRIRWAPVFHLPCLAWAAFVEVTGRVCPLTPLEISLRRAAGDAGYSGGFVEHYLVPIVYPGNLTAEVQIFLGVGLILINVAVYAVVLRRGSAKGRARHEA
jgi:hypothetical protein